MGKKKGRGRDGGPRTQADGSRCMDSRPTSVQLLSTWTGDSAPSLLVVADAERLVFNAPEGWQRLCVEHGVKVARVSTLCVTDLSPSAVGGLPGYMLTAADAGLKSLRLCGPTGLQAVLASTRHFMRRDDLSVAVEEAAPSAAAAPCLGAAGGDRLVSVEAVVIESDGDGGGDGAAVDGENAVDDDGARAASGAREIRRAPGRRVRRAPGRRARRATKHAAAGPLFGALKRGETVTLADGRAVEPSQVVAESKEGACFLVVHCASAAAVAKLAAHAAIAPFLRGAAALDCAFHLTPPAVATTAAYASFLASFPAGVAHVAAHATLPSPYATQRRDARLLRRLEPACYAEPGGAGGAGLRVEGRVVDGRPLLKYVLVPRDGRGLDDSEVPAPEAADAGDWDAAVARGVLEAAANIAAARAATPPDALRDARDAELVFLGTGSAIPSKHRNVSGIYLRCRNAPGAATPAPLPAPREPGAGLLLDCGEGTLGQLHKVYGGATDAVLAGLGAIWVSHPHADHHLGLPALLAARRRLGSPPVALMAPWPVLRFLADYGRAFGDLRGTYEPVECQWMGERAPNPAAATLRETLGLEACFCVPVVHCAQSYGLVVRSADGWSLAYSGDCRPSRELAAAARGATVLVHEATFEDEFWEDARAKRHSTISEAVAVGADAGAARTVLTHFSQRYPSIPYVESGDDGDRRRLASVVLASDLMHVTFPQLAWAPTLLPALKLLYGEEEPAEPAA
ncbi:3'-tRNA processing endoribonuclease [Aureococcus anophagefferens]|uniref:ribonuclease Z n=1 Tax=Aureococcus anophagefferens TaxID=44056 RepID=A0ABR1FKS9_AURAN